MRHNAALPNYGFNPGTTQVRTGPLPKTATPTSRSGSAHCVLIPYWASVLGKKDLHARQVSKRGGELFCRLVRDRVRIAGRAALYLEEMIKI